MMHDLLEMFEDFLNPETETPELSDESAEIIKRTNFVGKARKALEEDDLAAAINYLAEAVEPTEKRKATAYRELASYNRELRNGND